MTCWSRPLASCHLRHRAGRDAEQHRDIPGLHLGGHEARDAARGHGALTGRSQSSGGRCSAGWGRRHDHHLEGSRAMRPLQRLLLFRAGLDQDGGRRRSISGRERLHRGVVARVVEMVGADEGDDLSPRVARQKLPRAKGTASAAAVEVGADVGGHGGRTGSGPRIAAGAGRRASRAVTRQARTGGGASGGPFGRGGGCRASWQADRPRRQCANAVWRVLTAARGIAYLRPR